MRKKVMWMLFLLGGVMMTTVQAANTDETRVPAYTLPDPLVCRDGTRVHDAAGWAMQREALLEVFRQEVYGHAPDRPAGMRGTVESVKSGALGGLATRKLIRIRWDSDAADVPDLHVLMYLPQARTRPVAVFAGLNFRGNQAVHADPEIPLSEAWMGDWGDGTTTNARATEASRGIRADRWQVERILARGYGLVTAYYGDLDPDFDDGFQNGVHALAEARALKVPAETRWGSIGAWAWGLSRILDYLETDPDVNATQVAVFGHSRLGKAALWAGAQDTRFAMVISNNSGCGGAALSRRAFGETVALINGQFPHWFCRRFHAYNGREADLPIDQHTLLALVAPRPLYVASAVEDTWADPRGEFLSALHAGPVYQLLGSEGLPAYEMPAVESPVAGRIGYHIRRGKHGVTAYDWDRYLDFADQHFGPQQTRDASASVLPAP